MSIGQNAGRRQTQQGSPVSTGRFPRLLPLLVLGVLALLLAGHAAPALAGHAAPALAAGDEGATWRFTPVNAPPPPSGVASSSYTVPLGQIGDIEFWQPNRGLLITGGDGTAGCEGPAGPVPCGIWAYDGVSWHELSTVCGGAQGRIAWAGPDEFWTISDQRPGQLDAAGLSYTNVSLCHFQNGQFVGSYALPLGQPFSYLQMDAAACLNPSNCWFGGEIGQPPDPNSGAFHLHWDGQSVTVEYAPQDHAVHAMALVNQNTLLESVQLEPEDTYSAAEDESHPPLLHQVAPPGSNIFFHEVLIPDPGCSSGTCPSLPNYGTDPSGRPVAPVTLGGLLLSGDFTASLAHPASQLWAIAGPDGTPPPPSQSSLGAGHPLALRYAPDPATGQWSWSQVLGGTDPGGDDPFNLGEVPTGLAAEPGAAAAWVTVEEETSTGAPSSDGQAHVDRLAIDPSSGQATITAQEVLGDAQGVGQRGSAGPIACPAAHECWLATNRGYLFHLTNGSALEQDTDPSFAGILTYRPPDPGVPQLPPNTPPPDDSLANQIAPPTPPATSSMPAVTLTHPALIVGLRSHLVHRTTLELSFKLIATAHVQLLAMRHGRLVASTHRLTLTAGRRRLMLSLNPHRWPTKLDLKATPLHPLPSIPVPSGGSSTTPAPSNSNSLST